MFFFTKGYCMVGNFCVFSVSRAIHEIKTLKFLLSMCKRTVNRVSIHPTWNYLYSHQQKPVSECAFDGYCWSYPKNWSAT